MGMRRDGSEFPINLSISEVIEDGFHLFTAIVRDLTDEFETAKLKQAEDECLPQLVFKFHVNGDAISMNKKFREYTGITEEDVESSNVFDPSLNHPDDLSACKQAFAAANADKEMFEIKRRVLGSDGNYLWFLTRGSPILDEQTNEITYCGSDTDVDSTERIQVFFDMF
jgi:PAS domain S-box-containing protein